MDLQGAAVISDDGLLIESLDHQLRDLRGWELARSSVSDWLTGETRWVRPQTLWLDLRDPLSPLWADLEQIPAKLRSLRGTGPVLVGIVDGEVPVDAAIVADALLADWVTLDHPGAVSESLERCQAVSQARQGIPERRELRGTTHAFSTCTPELFVPMERLEMVARSDFSILLIGETGTGKTTLARIIHELSPRRDQRFMPVACGALPGDLIDSELFGHVKGSFTGADRDKEGKFSAAGKGTILLDEIDVLENLQQAKLLRVLETGEYEPVGSNATAKSACRTIVASNLRLEGLIESGQFRSDLYYRLDQMKFEIPPLRRRPLDIVPLAMRFIAECCEEQGQTVHSVQPQFLRAIRNYSWPGNIRELRNEMRRAALFARDRIITVDLLSPSVLNGPAAAPIPIVSSLSGAALADEIAITERESIERMLRQQEFNRAATARALGISRVTLYNKIRKYRINLDEK
ncbi:MAG: sigma-54-dependent Fis family transcriptional regulator [Planctomycetales bacterium]|nr:sigma-54-dependent Fis family transcriptional regulator [Planctomycetales bacterium]